MNKHTPQHGGSFTSYTLGFVLSILLTVGAYLLVTHHVFMTWTLVAAVSGLAFIQLLVQLILFLHLDQEQKPRWNLLVFGFMLMIIFIVVVGTIWIMNNINYHHQMVPSETTQFIQQDEIIKQ